MNRYMIGTAAQAAEADEDSMDSVMEALDLTPSWGEIMGDDAYRYEIDEEADQRALLGVDTIPSVIPGGNWNNNSTVVSAVQQALLDKGYSAVGKVDGKYGPKTRAAILDWHSVRNEAANPDIDNVLLTSLGVPVPSRSEMASSGSAAHADTQSMARGDVPADTDHAEATSDAAKAVADQVKESNVTPEQMAQQMALLTGMAFDPQTPPPSDATQKKIADAKKAVAAAKTPEQKKDAQAKVADVAKTISVEKNPHWFNKPLWAGSTMQRWHGLAIGLGGLAIITGFGLVARRA